MKARAPVARLATKTHKRSGGRRTSSLKKCFRPASDTSGSRQIPGLDTEGYWANKTFKHENSGPNEKRLHSRNSRCAFRATFNNPSHYKGWSKGHSQEKKGKIWVIWYLLLPTLQLAVSKNKGTPKWMVYNGKLENPIKMDDLGVPQFLETPNSFPFSSHISTSSMSEAGRPAKRIVECLHQARTESHSAMASNGHLSFGG